MAEILLSKLNTLPATADANELLFIKNGSLVSMYITDVEGTPVGVIPAGDYVKQVNGSGGTVQLNLSFSGGKLGITGGNQVNLDNRYFKSTDHINWSAVDLTPTTLAGYGISDAYTKSQSDAITGLLSNLNTSTKTNLVSAINELLTSINEGMRTPEPIDCSTNPDYPASEEGDTYKVTAAGKIGGDNGKEVEVNDTIICTATNGGGDQAAVGGSFYVIQGNITDATTSVKGLGRIATQAEVNAGNEDQAWVTPSTMSSYLSSNYYTKAQSDGRYLQSFTETDPVYTADKPGILAKGVILSNTDISQFYDIGAFYRPSSQSGNTNEPFGDNTGAYGLANFDMNYMLRLATKTKFIQPKIQWGARGDLSSWLELGVEGSNISIFNNDAGYLTTATVPTPDLQAVTDQGATTNNTTYFNSGVIVAQNTGYTSGGKASRIQLSNQPDGMDASGAVLGAFGDATNPLQFAYWAVAQNGVTSEYNSNLSLRLYPDGSLWYGTPPASTSAATQIFALGSDGHTISTRTAAEILGDIGAIGNKFTAGMSWDDAFSTGTAMLLTASGGAPSSKTYNGIYIPHSVDINYGTELAFRDNEMYFRSREAGTINAWVQMADRDWVTSQNYLTSIPIATSSILGGIKVGTRLSITAGGTMSADKQTDNNFTDALLNKLNGISAGANNYTLPVASTTTLGGVKLGVTMVMNNQAINAKTATDTQAGIVKPGGNMAVDAQGTITAQWKEVEW